MGEFVLDQAKEDAVNEVVAKTSKKVNVTAVKQKKAVKMYRIDRMRRVDIAKKLKLPVDMVEDGIIDFERVHNVKTKKKASVGDIIDFYRNEGLASGEVTKVNDTSVIVKIIDMKDEDPNLLGVTVVNHKRYRVVNREKLGKLLKDL